MPGFKLKNPDGTVTQYTTKISPFLTHEQTRPNFEDGVSFEISQLEFQSSVGTYIDSPYHRFKGEKDISDLLIPDLIKYGVVIDARGLELTQEFKLNNYDSLDVKDKAVLFNFGYDLYWGMERYHHQPFISEEIIDFLIDQKAAIVGVDTINIDDTNNLKRPAHTKLLKQEIPIVENLRGLDKLHGKKFKFYAVPIKAQYVAAMPVRAFAEILEL